MLHLLRRITPRWLLSAYHFVLAYLAVAAYGFPSRHLTVIGVTGTYGKSSSVMLLGRVLTDAGHRVGWLSTATISDGVRTWYNAMKMTMPGRFVLQQFFRTLVRNGCTHAIIETSSEGIAQHRHRGISYDVAMLTNLHPEHIEAHGGFERYRAAKAELFRHIARGSNARRIAIIPSDLERPEQFIQHHFLFWKSGAGFTDVIRFSAADERSLHLSPALSAFPGNAAVVLVTATALGIPRDVVVHALQSVPFLPGRLERIDCGQPFEIIVDYAFTPHALETVYRALPKPAGRTIHVLGAAGGGRDRWKRPVTGSIAAANASVVIVTNEDPYDEDPATIIAEVAQGARQWYTEHGGNPQTQVLTVLDRRDALTQALALAEPGDRVLVTGKGCEQAIVGRFGQKVPWDDRVVLRELLSYASHQTL